MYYPPSKHTEILRWYHLYLLLFFFRFSVSNDLKYDAERDLRDIGAKNIQVHSLNKVRYVHDTRMQTVRRVYWLHYVRV